jgi:hypothetical protein
MFILNIISTGLIIKPKNGKKGQRMKRLIKTIGFIAIFGALATASTNDSTTVKRGYGGNHCDPIEHLIGMCNSSQTLLSEN